MAGKGKGLDGGTPPKPEVERILGDRQRAEFERIRKTQGLEAAQAYKAQIATKKGIDYQAPGSTPATDPNDPAPTTDAPLIDYSNPQGVVEGQIDLNQKQAEIDSQYNRVNEQGPFGGATYETAPDGTVTRTVTLSPEEQAKYDQNQAFQKQLGDQLRSLQDQVAKNYQQPLNYDGIGNAPDPTQLEAERKRIEEATYGRLTRDYGERFSRETENLQQKLANEGVDPGSQQYAKRMEDLRLQQQRSYDDARGQATALGGQEYERSYNIGADSRSRAIDERMNLRNNATNEMANLARFREGVNMPNVSGLTQVNTGQAPDAGGIGLGYANFLEQQRQFNQSLKEQKRQFNQTPRGGGGGGGLGYDPMELERLRQQGRLDEMYFQNYYNQQNQPDSPNPWAGAAGSFAGGLGQGAGMYFGNKYGGK